MPLPPIEALGIGLRGSKCPMFTVHVQAIWSTLAWWPTRWFFWVYRWHRRRWSRASALLLSLARSCFVLAVDCAFYVSTSALRTNWLIDWSIDWSIDRSIDRLIDRSIDWLADIDWFDGRDVHDVRRSVDLADPAHCIPHFGGCGRRYHTDRHLYVLQRKSGVLMSAEHRKFDDSNEMTAQPT